MYHAALRCFASYAAVIILGYDSTAGRCASADVCCQAHLPAQQLQTHACTPPGAGPSGLQNGSKNTSNISITDPAYTLINCVCLQSTAQTRGLKQAAQ